MMPVRRWATWLSTPGPTTAIEIAADRVSAVTVGAGRKGLAVAGHATEPLPSQAITPAVASSNLVDRGAVLRALSSVVKALPSRPVRVGLVVPDSAAKVSIVSIWFKPVEAGMASPRRSLSALCPATANTR